MPNEDTAALAVLAEQIKQLRGDIAKLESSLGAVVRDSAKTIQETRERVALLWQRLDAEQEGNRLRHEATDKRLEEHSVLIASAQAATDKIVTTLDELRGGGKVLDRFLGYVLTAAVGIAVGLIVAHFR